MEEYIAYVDPNDVYIKKYMGFWVCYEKENGRGVIYGDGKKKIKTERLPLVKAKSYGKLVKPFEKKMLLKWGDFFLISKNKIAYVDPHDVYMINIYGLGVCNEKKLTPPLRGVIFWGGYIAYIDPHDVYIEKNIFTYGFGGA